MASGSQLRRLAGGVAGDGWGTGGGGPGGPGGVPGPWLTIPSSATHRETSTSVGKQAKYQRHFRTLAWRPAHVMIFSATPTINLNLHVPAPDGPAA